MTHFISNNVAKALADTFDDQVNAGAPPGFIKIYAGALPADADAAIGGATLLATLTFSNPAFGAATDGNPGGLLTAGTITADSSADTSGTAAFYRIWNAAGTTIAQGVVSTSGANINFNTIAFVASATISITSLTYTMPES